MPVRQRLRTIYRPRPARQRFLPSSGVHVALLVADEDDVAGLLRKNVASQHFGFRLVNAATGAALAGATVTAVVSKNGGAQGAAGGSVTDLGGGQYDFAPSQGDTNANECSFYFTATSAVPVEKTFLTTAADPTDATSFGLADLDAAISTRLASTSISLTAGAVTVGTNNDKTDYGLSSTALSAIWAVLTSTLTTVGSIGKLLVDNINATIASRASWDALTSTLTTAGSIGKRLADDIDATISSRLADVDYTDPPSAADNADAVWDEALAGHLGAGSCGEALNASGAVGDPWTTTIPGAYGAGSAGFIVGTLLDAAITTRLADADFVDPPTLGDIADSVWDEPIAGHLTAGSTGELLDDAGTAGDPWSTALPGAYSAGQAGKIVGDTLDAAVSSRLAAVDISLAAGAVTVGTNNDKTGYGLSAGAIQAIWDALTAALTTVGSVGKLIVDNVNATIASRLASGSITLNAGAVTVGTNLDKTSYTLTSGERNSIADATLDRADAIEVGFTLRQATRLMAAALAGKLSGASTTTVTIRNLPDTKDRITATVDGDGNRTAVTLDGA